MKYLCAASILAITSHAASYCFTGNKLCFVSTANSTAGTMTFQVTSQVAGWVGIGFNSNTMAGADIVTMYTTSSGDGAIQDRTGTAHALPGLDATPLSTLISATKTGTETVFLITRPLSSFSTGSIKMIAAYSGGAVSNSNLQVHDDFDYFTIDLNADVVSVSTKTKSVTKFIHGLIMVISWLFCTSGGIYVARFSKGTLGAKWFLYHFRFGMACFFLTIIAFILALTSVTEHFESFHAKIGLLVVVVMVFQVGLGLLINKLWTEGRTQIPWHDKLHWWSGRILFLIALLNILFGIMKFGDDTSALRVIYLILVLMIAAAFVRAQLKYGQTHHVNQAGEPIALSQAKLSTPS